MDEEPVLPNDERNDIICNMLSGDAAGPSIEAIQALQRSGKLNENDNATFCSKFVDPSSSDTDDENLENFDATYADEKELENAILSAAKGGHIEVVQSVLEKSSRFVGAIDEDLYTPLHRAAYNGHLHVMRLLLQHGADPNAPTLEGWTPLHSACCWGKVEAAALLLKAGSRVNARSYSNTTPLHTAANRPDNRPMLELLLSTPGVDPSITNDGEMTPGQIAARIGPYGFLFEPFESSLMWSLNENSNDK